MRATFSHIGGTCGVGVWSNLNQSWASSNPMRQWGGIGYNVVGFVDTPNCRSAYNEIKEKHTIVFQSPVKRNQNSGNKFFFIVVKKGKK